MAESYSKALSDLARENPVLAFELRGRDKAVVLISTIREFMKSSTDQEDPSDEDFSMFNPIALRMSEGDLRQAIGKIAWRCDIIIHVKVSMHLRKSQDQNLFEEGTDVVRRLIEESISAHQPPTVAAR